MHTWLHSTKAVQRSVCVRQRLHESNNIHNRILSTCRSWKTRASVRVKLVWGYGSLFAVELVPKEKQFGLHLRDNFETLDILIPPFFLLFQWELIALERIPG